MRPRRLIQCTTVGLAVLMIGCGDGDGKTTTTQEWVTAADAICAQMNTQLEPIPEPQTIEQFATAHAQVNEIWRNGLDELQELDLPDGNEAAATEVLDAFDQLIDVSLQWSDAFIAAGSMEVEDMTPSSRRSSLNSIRPARRAGSSPKASACSNASPTRSRERPPRPNRAWFGR